MFAKEMVGLTGLETRFYRSILYLKLTYWTDSTVTVQLSTDGP